MRIKTVLQLINCLGFSLIQFSSLGYYWQKKIKLMLEQYLKLDQRSESINYHCIMLWSSLVRIIWANKFVTSKKYKFYNFHLDDQNHWYCWWFLLVNIDYFQKNLRQVCWDIFTTKLLIHHFTQISCQRLPTVQANFKCLREF